MDKKKNQLQQNRLLYDFNIYSKYIYIIYTNLTKDWMKKANLIDKP